jgi:hypothetical protein
MTKILLSNLKPGSWLEMQEPKLPAHCDDDTYAGTQFEKWQNLALEASQKLGCPMDIASTCKATMEAVGFEDVTEVIYKWPINKWPADKKMKEIGKYRLICRSQETDISRPLELRERYLQSDRYQLGALHPWSWLETSRTGGFPRGCQEGLKESQDSRLLASVSFI